MKLRNIGGVACAMATALFLVSGHAAALSNTCTVSKVGYTGNGGGTLQIVCGGTFYFAFGSSGTCPTASADTKKAWQSLAQSALLSGKPVFIEYDNVCSGGPALTYLRLGG